MTALLLRIYTLSMMKLLLSVKLLQVRPLMLLDLMKLLLNMLLPMRLLQFMNHLKVDLLVDLEAGGTTGVEEELELDLVKLKRPKFGHLMNKNCM